MMLLTVRPATPILTVNSDGSGYELLAAYDGNHAQLQIGNVSIAFDGRNIYPCPDGESHLAVTMEFAEYTGCPVRLDNVDCPKCDDVAETIMFALAADLGYTISKEG